MTTREAHLLSPYRPPTSYPVSLSSDEAESWLHAYFALWHPAVLHDLFRPPIASSPYDHDRPQPGFVYAVPAGPHLYQPDDWSDRVVEAGAIAFKATACREDTRSNLIAALRAADRPEPLVAAPDNILRLFAAVGYGHLLVDSLFEAMDHERLLDNDGFWADIQSAVAAVHDSLDEAEVRSRLKLAVEKLGHARQSLNSNSLRLFDFVMPDLARLDAPWPTTLTTGLPLAVISSGEVLEALRQQQPERFAELKTHCLAAESPHVDLCIGSYREREDALLPAESQFWNWRKARETVRSMFGLETTVYGRKRSALHPQLPAWLRHAGYQYAVVVGFDGALTPVRNAAIVNWSSPDGQSLDAYGKEPHDAADSLTFFNLVYHLHQALTQDSTPVIGFKHTGNGPAVGYDELVALASLGDAIGEWSSLSRFLAEQHYGDYLGNTTADDYFSDYLDDRVTNAHKPDPVSGFARHLRLRRQLDSALALAALHRTLTPQSPGEEELLAQLEQAEDEIEKCGVDLEGGTPAIQSLNANEAAWAKKLADRIQSRAVEGQPGLIVFNTCNFTRRVTLELDDFGGPIPVADAVKAAQFQAGSAKLVVEVPSLGFAWIPKTGSTAVAPPRARIQTAEGNTVRNEFIEAEFDPVTGALRAFRDLRTRVNRLGMQMVFNPGSKTRARSVTVTNAGTALGEVVCEGDVLDEHDTVLATFKNRIRAWVGRPALELRIELEPVRQPTGYPWHAYFGARFAWRDERAALFRGAYGSNVRSTYTRPVSPDYIELRIGSERTFVFTGGLPFVQKHATRMADIILVPEGEKCRTYDLLLACDRDYPMQTAAGWVAPVPVVHTTKGPPHIGPTGWLGHVDLPSLLMTSLRPCPPGPGMTRAVAARFQECAGFGGGAEIRFARDADRAHRLDGDGIANDEVPVVGGGVPVEFSAAESFRIRTEWA